MGRALARALADAGATVQGPLGRDARPTDAHVVLLCVPESAIGEAAATIPVGPIVGHCSASAPLDLLAPHERFVLHPLMTATEAGATFTGAGAAISASSARALGVARQLADQLGMRPLDVPDDRRPLYHAASVMASNFLVALEGAAERVAAVAGVDRDALAPLVRAALENWARAGARQALTGPIARNEEETVARLRTALAQVAPELLPLWDALAHETRTLAGHSDPPATGEMRTIRTVAEVRTHVRFGRSRGHRIGLVPTMGALHEGHLSLIRRARAECDSVVVTIFVNPTQFNDAADLANYPRDEAADARLARSAGATLLFAPSVEEIYPPGFSTFVEVPALADGLEGEVRGRGHFQGVATIVTKLLNIVQADVAYFGQKDAQQALVIRRMVRDLEIDTRVEVCPIVREPDGLAMSSRNVRLSTDARARAIALSEALRAVEQRFDGGVRAADDLRAAGMDRLRARGIPAGDVDYFAIVDAESLQPVTSVDGRTLVAIAARVGGVRLLDNTILAAR